MIQSLKRLNKDPYIQQIKKVYANTPGWNIGLDSDSWHPITPELALSNYPNYTKDSIICVCKFEDIVFIMKQGHPTKNIVYLADNETRSNIAQSKANQFQVRSYHWNAQKSKSRVRDDRQLRNKFMKEFKDKIDIVIFRNRATCKGNPKLYLRYVKLAEFICKPKGYYSVTCSPMAMSAYLRHGKNFHQVRCISVGKLEKDSAHGGYVGITFQKTPQKDQDFKILDPIDAENPLAIKVLRKVLKPNTWRWFENPSALTSMIKSKIVNTSGKQDTVIKITGSSKQPFILGSCNYHKKIPYGPKILMDKYFKSQEFIAPTFHPAWPHISLIAQHDSWKTFDHIKLMSKFFYENKVVKFIRDCFGLPRTTYIRILRAFHIKEIKRPVDYPVSYQLTDKEKQYLDYL